ncbi:lipocalin family protein [Arenibacter sp. GZD96]|uniref:lipocalin family protein n=1 Tax=Aurantibrevibacter litoralis TaxID=3106030 RepID=UPI002AFFB77E|nr:lipocalin family protein [Arenibacter sp. GZD-96]MEA1786038.1 lipocalin family protein [Arenibacter sp. GZD-96]
MRHFLGYLFVCFVCSCTNDSNEEPIPASAAKLTGVWELTATRISPGGAVSWTPTTSIDILTFQSDGSFLWESEFLPDGALSGSFTADENLITLKSGSDDESEIIQRFGYQLTSNELILNGVTCIEECSFRYRRQG